MRRVSIAGPMSGRPNRNRAAFAAAAARWRAAGWQADDPFDHGVDATAIDWSAALRIGLNRLLHADALAVLPGWEGSAGAALEIALAVALGVPVFDAATGTPLGDLEATWHVTELQPDGTTRQGRATRRLPAAPPPH